MSYDLTIKSDETYSRSAPRTPLESFMNKLAGVKRNGKHGFALDARPKRWMEIDLEVVNQEGDNIENNKEISADVNCIRLHIPYKFLGDDPERDYLPTAFAIAEHVGWTLYDDQDGEPVAKVDGDEVAANAPPAFDRKTFFGDWISFPYSWGNAYMNYSIADNGRFEVTMIDDGGSVCVSAKGTWDLVGDAIQWTYESIKGAPRPRKPELNKVFHADETGFAIREPSGVVSEFLRPVPAKTISGTIALAEIRPFLERLIQPIDGGFAAREIDSLMATVNALGSVKSQKRIFKITFQGFVSPLCIEMSIGKGKTVAVTFSAPTALVNEIAAAFKAA